MNNGENTNQNTNTLPTIPPMEGVKIAPAVEAPIDASKSATNGETNTQQPQSTPPVYQPPVTPPQVPVTSQPKPQTPPVPPQVPTPPVENPQQEHAKKKKSYTLFFLLIILILGGYIVYSTKNHQSEIATLKYNCTPITASSKEIKLDINSTLVQDLYSKVHTTIREDLAQPEFNNEMKLYLAYRQILEKDKNETNCNLFSNTAMEPFKCEVSGNFIPKAFKEETLKQAIKKLYGEGTTLPLQNIQLGNTCLVGYQYIAARGEFVEGYCSQQNATSFKANKEIIEATSNKNTIIIKEEVTYKASEKMDLPSYLKNGYNYYTFRLDMNYNYVLVSKRYQSKY